MLRLNQLNLRPMVDVRLRFFFYPFFCPLREVLYVGHHYRIVWPPFTSLISQDHECPGVRRTHRSSGPAGPFRRASLVGYNDCSI